MRRKVSRTYAVLVAVFRGRLRNDAGLFVLSAEVDEHRRIAAIVEDHVGTLAAGPRQDLLGAPPILFERFALPREHGNALRVVGRAGAAQPRSQLRRGPEWRRCCSWPSESRTEVNERLDEHRCLDGHVQRTGDASTGEWLSWAELFTKCHQAGHFDLGQLDLFAAERGQRDIGDFERNFGFGTHTEESKRWGP